MTVQIYDILLLIGIPSIVSFIFQTLYTTFSNKRKKDRNSDILIKKALQALLRDRLRQNYICYINKRKIDLADKENYANMYHVYHSLGENGVMDDMYAQVMMLPITNNNNAKRKEEDANED